MVYQSRHSDILSDFDKNKSLDYELKIFPSFKVRFSLMRILLLPVFRWFRHTG